MTIAGSVDRAGIAALIPHAGSMCLLFAVRSWHADGIVCIATNHRDPDHPLRSARGLLASAAIEYAAQASAVHGGLLARGDGRRAPPGRLASARDVRLGRPRLDDLPPADADELVVRATRQAGDTQRLLYAWGVAHDGVEIASGRLAVVLLDAAEPTGEQ